METRKRLSIVVPVNDEETNLQPFYERLTASIERTEFDTEIIFIDDGSQDHSYEGIRALARRDARVKCLRFSRNFGSHAAILAGLRSATGDAAVMISADLQDPPEVISELLREWREGFHVVWAVRRGRQDPLIKKLFAWTFYRIFRRIGLPDYPASGMDFGLVDHAVLDCLREMRELNHLITGVIVWLGFRQAVVPYYRQARHSGRSKWSFGKRIKVAIDAIASFSYFPIRFISYTGLFVSLVSFLYAVFLVIRRVFFGLGSSGWPSVMAAVLFLGGLQLVMLGVLGEYIWRTLEQTRGRPPYVIMESIGFDLKKSG